MKNVITQPWMPSLSSGRGGALRLGDQHVAIGQDIEPARMIEVLGEGGHLQARCRRRLRAGGPAFRRGDVHRWEHRLGRRRQGGVRPHARRHRQLRPLAAGGQGERRAEHRGDGDRGAGRRLSHDHGPMGDPIGLPDRSRWRTSVARSGSPPHRRLAAKCARRGTVPARSTLVARRTSGQAKKPSPYLPSRSARPVPGDAPTSSASGPGDVSRVHALHPDLGRAVLR